MLPTVGENGKRAAPPVSGCGALLDAEVGVGFSVRGRYSGQGQRPRQGQGPGQRPDSGAVWRPKRSRGFCGQTTPTILTGSSLGPGLEMRPVVLTLSALFDMAPFSLCRCIHKPLTAVVSPCAASSVSGRIDEGQTSF